MPPAVLGPLARQAKQCQRCFKPETETERLQSCSGCHKAHYCSKECQKTNWPNHKIACKMNRETRASVKAMPPSSSSSSAGDEPNARDIEDALKPWRQIHKPVVLWALTQALDLYHHPENIDTYILQLRLKPAFSGRPLRNADHAKSFHLEGADVISYNDTVAIWSENPQFRPMLGQLGSIKAQSQAIQRQGGTGVGIVLILVGRGLHVVPCGVTDLLTGSPELYNPNWQQEISRIFEKGTRL